MTLRLLLLLLLLLLAQMLRAYHRGLGGERKRSHFGPNVLRHCAAVPERLVLRQESLRIV